MNTYTQRLGVLSSTLGRRRIEPIWIGLVLLLAVSPLIASGSLGSAALRTMLPFAAILAVAAIGQTLVIQQGGLDFSVAGMISLAAVLFTQHCAGSEDRVLQAIALVLGVAVVAGLVNGLLVARLGVTALIATLGTNALMLGAALQLSGGTVTEAPSAFHDAVTATVLGIPRTAVFAAVVVALVAVLMSRTVFGRWYAAVGTAAPAAELAGLPVLRTRVIGYTLATLSYGVAGIMLAGFLGNPEIYAGDQYLLATVAAVVLGGASLAGGRASVIATAGGALFLTQLNQLVLSSGAETWAQYVIQGGVIAVAMGIRNIPWRRRDRPGIGSPGPSRPMPAPREVARSEAR